MQQNPDVFTANPVIPLKKGIQKNTPKERLTKKTLLIIIVQ